MERFIQDVPKENPIEIINNDPEIDSGEIDGGEESKYNDEIPKSIRERAEEILEKYDKDKERKATQEDIDMLAKEQASSKEEADAFNCFLENKFGIDDKKKEYKISRRNLLKISGVVACGVVGIIKYGYLKENFNKLWTEFMEQRENDYEIEYSKEMTALYKKTKNLPEKDLDSEAISENLKNIDKNFELAELIKNSAKENIEILPELLKKENNDVVIFSEYHGAKSNAKNTVEILEKFKEKSDKKVSKIGLEGLDYTDMESAELVNKFNNGQISANDLYFKSYFRTDVRLLLEFAQKNNIPIEGIEDEEKFGHTFDNTRGMRRYTRLSHKVGSMAKEKKGDEVIIIFTGADHATINNWGTDSVQNRLSQIKSTVSRSEKDIISSDENDYTFKEYLNKIGLKSAVINLKDLGYLSQINDHIMGQTNIWLLKEDSEKRSKEWKEKWNNYKSDQNEPYLIIPRNEKESYEFINPEKIPEAPPALNVFETIKNNYPDVAKMIRNKYIDYQPIEYNMFLVSQTGDGIAAKMADMDLDKGKIKKLYSPEQLKEK
jgi:hypothetical protein